MKTPTTDPQSIAAAVQHWEREIRDTRQQIVQEPTPHPELLAAWQDYIRECQQRIQVLTAPAPTPATDTPPAPQTVQDVRLALDLLTGLSFNQVARLRAVVLLRAAADALEGKGEAP